MSWRKFWNMTAATGKDTTVSMPPRIPILPCLRAAAPHAPNQFTLPLRPFSVSAISQVKLTEKEKWRKRVSHDPYLVAQRNRKKAANLSRRAELEEGRAANLGDPVRGVPTPFVQSFESGKPVQHMPGGKIPKVLRQDALHLNYAFDPKTVERQLKKSRDRAVPLSEIAKQQAAGPYQWSSDPHGSRVDEVQKSTEEIETENNKNHARAAEAIARITALENGSSKDRMRVNIARCVETFGRHKTDKFLPPRAPPLQISADGTESHPVRTQTNLQAAAKRVGPDTGSSEVQIAILTAKIKTLADFLATRGKGDKHNKRNLRLLVHRRQKLLQYLRRKERGGPRWQLCIETLGLAEGTWKGEISL